MINRNIVILGISTGGPMTLRKFFADMPLLNVSIVLVLHMPRFINESVRKNLDGVTEMDVRIARHEERLEHGKIYIAPSEVHLELINNQIIQLVNSPKVCYVCPSVDVTMKSVRKKPQDSIIGIIMTGMGSDGKEGIRHIKSVGGTTFAQDEESSVIWGMPKAAISTGCVDNVLSPEGIRKSLISRLSREKVINSL